MDLTEEQRRMYDGEPWSWVARKAGLEPYNTESQARRVAETADGLIAAAFDAGWNAHQESVDTATTDIPLEHWRNTYLDEALGEENG